ncbi:LolA family protein [Natrinema sp. 74]|uniref:LolA family protein n=1 Tax=Natrinema sp. 74 TaxID=3384159 RepID=UPI0038D369CE
MTNRRFAVILVLLAVSVSLSGCAALDTPSSEREASTPDPEAVFEGAYVHADDLVDVTGVRRNKVTNGSHTLTEVMQVYDRPYVDQRTKVIDAPNSKRIGNVYVSNATKNWFYYPNAGVAQYVEPAEPFTNDEVRSSRAEMAAMNLEKYDIEYNGTDQVAGRETHVLDVEAKNETVEKGISAIVGDTEFVYALETSNPRKELRVVEQTLWIDTEYNYPLKEKVVFKVPGKERIVMVEQFESVTFNSGLDDETFAFEPPANATVQNIT